MPPRYAFWTILIDNKPTAFRAASRDDLLPTVFQLRRTNSDVALKWFARGRIWESPEAEREERRRPKVREARPREWRPGGAHRDPRARFKKGSAGQGSRPAKEHRAGAGQAFRPAKARSFKGSKPADRKPWGGKPGRRGPSDRRPHKPKRG